jgi:hypothetical protein
VASDDDYDLENEYADLPDDSELAYAVFHRRKSRELEHNWEQDQGGGWFLYSRRFVDHLIAFDEVHDLGLFATWAPPNDNDSFREFFEAFRRQAEIAAEKIKLEAARRTKKSLLPIVVLDATTRPAIHRLIEAIREKLNALHLPEGKRESLFSKLNAFAAEVDRNRTRTEAAFAFVVEFARAAREANDELKDVYESIDRLFGWIEKAKELRDSLPPWNKRKEIEGPSKQLEAPKKGDLDDDIPF